MEIPSEGTDDHLGFHKQPDGLPEKRALEAFKPDSSMEVIASKTGFSHENQGRQASEVLPHVDSSLEKLDKQILTAPGNHLLPGKHDSTVLRANLLPEKQSSATPTALEKKTSELPGVDSSTEKHALISSSLPENQASERIELLAEKQAQASTEPPLLLEKTGGVVGVAPGVPASEIERAEIDTAARFESVKAAVTFFGERIELKPQIQSLDHVRKTSLAFDAQKANQEVENYQELLLKEEAGIAEILLKLEKTKEQIQMCKGRVPVSFGNGEVFPMVNQPEVLNVGWPKELYVNVLHELEMARKEIDGIHEECALLELSKQSALEKQKAAFTADEAASYRINELMTAQASSHQALAAAKAALAQTESEIDALRLITSIEVDCKSTSNSGCSQHASMKKVATLKNLELNLSEAYTLIEKLKEELATVRNAKSMSSSVSNSEGEIMSVKWSLEQAKASERDRVTALGRVLEELDVVKTNLSKVTQDAASLASAVGGLQSDVAKRQAELESAHETEQIACATLASLQDELCSIRVLVLAAHASEAKAREAKRMYPTEIKQLASQADTAKAASKLAKEESRKGAIELEQAKAAMRTAVSRLQAAQKEAEAVRASEAMAITEFMALSESKGELADSKEPVNITLEEYQTLNDARREAERSAYEKLAAALVQVEAAKVSQSNTQTKLDSSINEIEVIQKALEEAQKKADDAQTAKLSIEAELRKWRAEHEQRRRTGSNPSSVSTSAAQSPRLNAKVSSQGKVISHSFQSHSFQGKPAKGLDSLAEVLSLKLPAAEKPIQNLPEVYELKKAEKPKKLSFFSRVMSIIVRKKNRSGK